MTAELVAVAVAVAVAAALFLGGLVVLVVLLWRSPAQLARTVTAPLQQQLRELTDALRAHVNISDTQTARLNEHNERLAEVERRLAEHDRLLRS